MLAEKNPILEDVVKTLYEMSEEEQIREQCMAREDYYRTISTYEAEILYRDQRLKEKDQQLNQKDQQIEELMQEVRRLRGQQNIDAE